METGINPLISIITVVFNSESFIERTILSIINQTYKNIEYIIIDGGSTDNTIGIIKRYEKNISFWKSEPDSGLYDAMNKGINNAKGRYLWFVNAGDEIYSHDTLENIFNNQKELSDIYYGETMITSSGGNEIGLRRLKAPENLTWESFKMGMVVCHQSVIVRKSIAPAFDLNYKCSADYDWVLKSLKKAAHIKNTHMLLSKFMAGGRSRKTITKSLKERFRIMRINYGLFPTLFNHIVIGIKFSRFVLKHRRI